MCSRFTLNATAEVIARTFDLDEVPDIEHRYNIGPNQFVAAIRNIESHNELGFMKWGFIPIWSKDITKISISACSETAHEDPTFQHALKFRRCIIPASGFYGWENNDSQKQPYHIRLLNSGIMGIAGLWETLTTNDGSQLETCCILTTAANELVMPFNDRMPVILQPDEYSFWLNKNIYDTQKKQNIYQSYPSDLMAAHPVPDLVNNPRFDSAACIVQV